VKKNKKRSGADSGYSSISDSTAARAYQPAIKIRSDADSGYSSKSCSAQSKVAYQPAMNMLPRVQLDPGQYPYARQFELPEPDECSLPDLSGADSGYSCFSQVQTQQPAVLAIDFQCTPIYAYEPTDFTSTQLRLLSDKPQSLRTKCFAKSAKRNSSDFARSHRICSSDGKEHGDYGGHVGAVIKDKAMEDSIAASDDEGIEDEM
jgi:hypothetical protein